MPNFSRALTKRFTVSAPYNDHDDHLLRLRLMKNSNRCWSICVGILFVVSHHLVDWHSSNLDESASLNAVCFPSVFPPPKYALTHIIFFSINMHRFSFYIFYMYQLGFYLYSLFAVLFLDVRRKDWPQLVRANMLFFYLLIHYNLKDINCFKLNLIFYLYTPIICDCFVPVYY